MNLQVTSFTHKSRKYSSYKGKVEVEISDRTEVTKMVGEEVAVFPKAITNYTLLSGQEPKNITVTRNDQTMWERPGRQPGKSFALAGL